jgi:arginine/lysine/ornithine decarboxylase
VLHGLVLSGATPVYLPVHFHPGLGLPGMLRTEDLRQAIDAVKDSGDLLVLLHPSYYGLAGDLAEQIEMAHQRGILVLTDEAHGSHFCASPLFPASALTVGADFTVMGAHKTLGAFTQAAWLHCREGGEAASRVNQALRLVQTTSPSYLLMASLDVARHQLQQSGERWGETAGLGRRLRREISRLPGLMAPAEELLDVPGVTAYDPARLVVNVSGLGITGFTAGDWLARERRLLVEMADLGNLVFILGPGDEGPAAALLGGLQDLAAACIIAGSRAGELSALVPELYNLPIPRQILTPRQAFLAPHCQVALEAAVGKVAAETITPYPPGVPLICPGEVIDKPVLDCLKAWRQAGGTWPGQAGGATYVVDGS